MLYDTALYILYAFSALLLAGYYLCGLFCGRERRIGKTVAQDTASRPPLEGMSVVVTSRNGLENLRALIPSLLAQKYPKFEIVIVNDRSVDNTDIFLKSVQRNYPTVLRAVSVPTDTTYPWPGRKFAITMGVKAARYDRIVLLDNTSVPSGENWLDTLASAMEGPDTVFLIACTGASADGGLFVADDFRRTASAMAWTGAGMPFRARASNFVFRKSVFLQRNGYMRDMRVPSGEADFLIQDYATGRNTASVCSRGALTIDASVTTAAQRRERDVFRWAAFRHYIFSAKLKTLFPYALKLLFFVAAVLAGLRGWRHWEYWAVLAVPVVLSWIAGWVCARRFAYPRWLAAGIGIDVLLLPWKLLRWVVCAVSLPKGWK